MPSSPPVACPCGGKRINGVCDRGCNATSKGTIRRNSHAKTTTERGYGWDWQKFQPRFLAENPLCQDCLDKGIVTAASEVHHVVKIKDRPDRKLDPDNCKALCKPCHLKRSAKGE
jgi:5-methylcytosine-specific restriction protein A